MRKLISLFLVVCCIASFIPNAYAVARNDSLRISEDEITAVKDNNNQTILKLYAGSFMHCFAEGKGIAEIVSDRTASYMLISPNGEIIYKNFRNGQVQKLNPSTGISDWSNFYQFALEPNTVFDPSVDVQNIYCLNGEPNHDGVYIYYETSSGDYILYKEYLSASVTYLFPLDDFYKLAEIVSAERKNNAYKLGGTTPIEELFDLSPYLFTARPIIDFGVLLISAIAFVLIALGATVFITKRRNKS